MILEPIKPEVLGVRVLPDLHPSLASKLGLREEQRSIGMITCSSDDALYAALDQGTKEADVEVVYAKSFYAGSAHASGPYSGEIIGIYAARDPDILNSGINGALEYLEHKAWFFSANERNTLAFFPHVITQTGQYLSHLAGVELGAPLAYLIAPPLEAILGLDAALKAADVELRLYYPPPSETNYAGGLLVGEIPECQAAAEAFQAAVLDLAKDPVRTARFAHGRAVGDRLSRAARGVEPRFRLAGSGMGLEAKGELYTHLRDNNSLVRKSHPIIRLRGKLDMLSATILDAQLAAREEGLSDVEASLSQVLDFARRLLKAEVTGLPAPAFTMDGFGEEELHHISHRTLEYMNVGFLLPDASMGKAVVKLNLLRASVREVELCAIEVFDACPGQGGEEARGSIIRGLNRLSNAVYVLTCKMAARFS